VQLSPEVREALERGAPVVALESTIISHGMPYPRNLEVAREVEEAVRSSGAVPATIAVIDGIPRAGLSEAHMLTLANQKGTVLKASTRDLGNAMARGLTAATTVAATMKLAHLAGISVFAQEVWAACTGAARARLTSQPTYWSYLEPPLL
jgi:pseudouridine-5'-phosphate glycosidase